MAKTQGNGTILTTVHIPLDLHDRAKRVAKRMYSSVGQLIRDGLLEKVDFFEAKFHAEEERARAQKEAKKNRSLRSLSSKLPAPADPAAESETLGDGNGNLADVDGGLNAIYELHAKRILEVINGDAREKRLRVIEAVAAVKKYSPLTHPQDMEIVANFEKAVAQMQRERAEEANATAEETPRVSRVIDRLVGREINPKKTKSFGDLEMAEDGQCAMYT